MVLRIRLARFGNKHKPFYNIVVAQARSARGSKPLEVIGTYNPLPIERHGIPDHLAPPRPFKDITLDKARAKYWLGVGAQASDPVWKLLNMARLLEEKPKTYQKA
ncbi:hypothetical protein PENSTE_c015G10087 [Penicillium steckii]|uniref:Ribosomal protein S16 n=1 Tax=Penicillium steckii TaxID=303698 RepID=A0A1V6T0X1_9EURO|nr:hypothetical protein PENSTE_c015G10087 [Penicillium steckii]